MHYRMPNMDGPSATEAIRCLGYRGQIVGVTGNAMQHDIDHYLSKGADRVLTKPVDIKALLRLMDEHQLSTKSEQYNVTTE